MKPAIFWKTLVKPLVILLFFISGITNLLAQKPQLQTKEEVEAAVEKEMSDFVKTPTFQNAIRKKFPKINGEVTVDLGIDDKGKVNSFFKVESTIMQIDFMEFLSDKLIDHNFNFKLEKNKRFKIRQIIQIRDPGS